MIGVNKDNVELGEKYNCKTSLLEREFSGTVIAKYENTCIVELLSCAFEDSQKALEYNNRFVIEFNDLA